MWFFFFCGLVVDVSSSNMRSFDPEKNFPRLQSLAGRWVSAWERASIVVANISIHVEIHLLWILVWKEFTSISDLFRSYKRHICQIPSGYVLCGLQFSLLQQSLQGNKGTRIRTGEPPFLFLVWERCEKLKRLRRVPSQKHPDCRARQSSKK